MVDWNKIASDASEAAVAAGRPGQATIIDFAKVQAAVHDAVQAIDRRYKPYHVKIRHASGSPAAAAAKAAHDMLVSLYPAQTAALDLKYHAYLLDKGLDEEDPGVRVGQEAAAGIIALRANDGVLPVPPLPPFLGGTGPGEWRPTPSYLPGPPPAFAPMGVPWLATVTPFTLKRPSQLRAGPHPALTSDRYTRDYDEVKAFGRFDSTERSPEQTDIGQFYAGNTPVMWNSALRDAATRYLHRISDTARLFALADVAAADAVITAWDSKRHYNFWRPVTAIQNGDDDTNDETIGDPDWKPLVNTPNYPDYTSGANSQSGSVTRALQLFFGRDRLTFSGTTTNPLAVQKTRTYHRFSDAAADVVNARIYVGFHFRFADTAARNQGRAAAEWAFEH
ncbi:MAG TPA: vanadium-dependent haloperoxidase, partial [Vicinamibacteria bacterium]|nr:vanadium-dependent haloperoxidase [Vicinamibacteria bacterium]